MREYIVSIETSNHNTIAFVTFAKDRKDAIEFAKRTHRAKFLAKEYLKVKGARQCKGWPVPAQWGESHDPETVKKIIGGAYEHYIKACVLLAELPKLAANGGGGDAG